MIQRLRSSASLSFYQQFRVSKALVIVVRALQPRRSPIALSPVKCGLRYPHLCRESPISHRLATNLDGFPRLSALLVPCCLVLWPGNLIATLEAAPLRECIEGAACVIEVDG